MRAAGYRISTGFLGTPVIADALTGAGHVDVAYRLLLQTECPSWLYPVTMGATTIWERWDSLLPDGRINAGGMTSFNHYALGAVADWLHRSVAGLAPAAPGLPRALGAPARDAGPQWASARHLTPYGEAAVRWEWRGSSVALRVVVPVGVRATVFVPGSRRAGRRRPWHVHLDGSPLSNQPSSTRVSVPSFASRLSAPETDGRRAAASSLSTWCVSGIGTCTPSGPTVP